MAKRKRKCVSCGVMFYACVSITTCMNCQKIRFHVRKIIPDHIPLAQTRKYVDMYMKKHPEILERTIKR